jgi:2'-5' RNA ligase
VTTIGLAIAIPEPWGEQLRAYRAELGDEWAELIPPHITLLPPIDVDDSVLSQITSHFVELARNHAPFRLHLRGTGTFRPVSPVVFVTVAEGISGCETLAASLREGPLAVDAEFPYHPHVTVAQRLPEETLDRAFEELATFECSFEVDRFQVFRHDDTQGWIVEAEVLLLGEES